jgi:histone H2A
VDSTSLILSLVRLDHVPPSAGFPKQTAAQTILAGLSKYFRQTATTHLQQVFFVLFDPESVNVYTTELQRMVE